MFRRLLLLIGRIPSWLALTGAVLWPAAWLLYPLLYARTSGFGLYWTFSVNEFVASLFVIVAPPALFICAWRAGRRRVGGRAA